MKNFATFCVIFITLNLTACGGVNTRTDVLNRHVDMNMIRIDFGRDVQEPPQIIWGVSRAQPEHDCGISPQGCNVVVNFGSDLVSTGKDGSFGYVYPWPSQEPGNIETIDEIDGFHLSALALILRPDGTAILHTQANKPGPDGEPDFWIAERQLDWNPNGHVLLWLHPEAREFLTSEDILRRVQPMTHEERDHFFKVQAAHQSRMSKK